MNIGDAAQKALTKTSDGILMYINPELADQLDEQTVLEVAIFAMLSLLYQNGDSGDHIKYAIETALFVRKAERGDKS